MVKLVRKSGLKPENQGFEQTTSDEQQNYLDKLKAVKGEMYQEKQTTEEQKENEEQLKDMVPVSNEQKNLVKKKGEKKGELRIKCNAELAEIYKLIAVHEGVSLSNYVTNILEAYLVENLEEIKKMLKVKNKFLS